jgi:hypothetical protein
VGQGLGNEVQVEGTLISVGEVAGRPPWGLWGSYHWEHTQEERVKAEGKVQHREQGSDCPL